MLSPRHIAITFALVSVSAHADTNFANCDRLKEEAQQAPLKEDAQLRLQQMGQLFNDMTVLNTESKNPKTTQNRSFMMNCYLKKKDAFMAHVEIARTDLQKNAGYFKLMGHFTEFTNGSPLLAFQYYSKAVELDPTDYDSFRNQYTNWFHDRETYLLSQKGSASPVDVAKFTQESNALLKPFFDNPKIPGDAKAGLIKVRQGLLEGMMNSESSAQFDNVRLLQINPNDKVALTKLAAYAYSRKNFEDAHKYLDRLAPLDPENQQIQERNIEMKVHFGEEAKVASLAPALAKKFPKSAEFPAAIAWAQFQQGQAEKAHATNSRALKLDPKNELALKNQEQILIKEGDEYKEKNMVAAALGAYDDAYKINPKNVSIRKKMPPLIYEYHKSQNFEPKEVAQKDMDRLMELLDPIMTKDAIDRANVEIYIFASAHSNKPIKGAKACSYYKENYSTFSNIDLVKICVRALKGSGKKDEANEIVKKALQNPRFQESRAQLSQEMLN